MSLVRGAMGAAGRFGARSFGRAAPPPARRRRGLVAGPVSRAIAQMRVGRVQRLLAWTVAASAPALAAEIYLEHYKGSFGDRWEWAPIAIAPVLTASAVASARSEHAARTALPASSALYATLGVVGSALHLRGVLRRPGGAREPLYNLVMGPPLLAPGSLTLIGGIGMLAAVLPRERR